MLVEPRVLAPGPHAEHDGVRVERRPVTELEADDGPARVERQARGDAVDDRRAGELPGARDERLAELRTLRNDKVLSDEEFEELTDGASNIKVSKELIPELRQMLENDSVPEDVLQALKRRTTSGAAVSPTQILTELEQRIEGDAATVEEIQELAEGVKSRAKMERALASGETQSAGDEASIDEADLTPSQLKKLRKAKKMVAGKKRKARK